MARFLLNCLFLFAPILLFKSLAFGTARFDEKVRFSTPDGHVLVGLYTPPRNNKSIVILLHGLRSSKGEWHSLTGALVTDGYGVLAYDLRGHGESSKTKDKDGRPTGLYGFGQPGPGSDWQKMIDDLGRAILFLEKKKGIDRNKIYLMGASLGANVCLNYAGLTRSVQGLILLSPGENYMGIESEADIQSVQSLPVLIVTSPADHYAYESSLKLKKRNPKIHLWTDVKAGHGVQMFDEKLLGRIISWLDNPNK